ncbi:MAG: hypothetical protein C0403_05995, partial [Desulfobacterium sp.]|nr:hypothetical protein [Desulfobacterium sp.]
SVGTQAAFTYSFPSKSKVLIPSIYKYRFLFDQPNGLIYKHIIHSIPLSEFDQLLLDSFCFISKQDFETVFIKSIVFH